MCLQDVQLQNANAWASLSQPPEGAGTQGDGAGDAAPMEDDDTLWTEFKGREEEQRQAEEKKKALEEEEKKKKEAEETAARRAAEEAAAAERRAAEEAAAAKQKEEEERRRREAEELQQLDVRGAADAEVDMMRQAGHGAAADLEELGLAARPDEEDEEDDEAMDI